MNDHDLRTVAFPVLDEDQLTALRRCPLTTLKHYGDGEKLFTAGECDQKFFVVVSGEVVIVDDSEQPTKTVTIHHRGQFTGEVAQLTGSPSLVSAVARGDCEVCAVPPDSLRELLNRAP